MADRPNLPYRAGTYSTFLARMLSSLEGQTIPDGPNQGARPLRGVNTESSQDFITSLLRGWAAVGDVLTFYQERIAGECYLGPANEDRSVLELARAIGYRPNPGVAAGTYLAFTVADSRGSSPRVVVPRGTPVQSIPGQDGQLPQTFETSHEVEARAEWNSLHPHIPLEVLRQEVSGRTSRLRLRGLAAALNPGDNLLLMGDPTDEGPVWLLRTLKSVEPDPEKGYTVVSWDPDQWPDAGAEPLVNPRVFALRRRLTLFGHDAPDWESLPENLQLNYSPRWGGLQQSDSRGAHWQPVGTDLPGQRIGALTIDPTGVVYAGVSGYGVYRSTDKGQSWQAANGGLANLEVNTLLVDDRGHLLAGTANGVYRSADGGNQWEALRGEFRISRLPLRSPVDTDLPSTATRSLVTFSEPDHERAYLLAGTDRGIFRSVSDQTGWEAVNRGLPHHDGDSGEARITVFALAWDPRTRHLFAGTDLGVFRSTNQGRSWQPVHAGLPGTEPEGKLCTTPVYALAAMADPEGGETHLLAGTDRGVFRWTGGAQWEPASQGLPGADPGSIPPAIRVRSLVSYHDAATGRPGFLTGTDRGLFRSHDLGDSWLDLTPDLADRDVHALAVGPQSTGMTGSPPLLAMATPVTGVVARDWPDFHIRGNHVDLDTSQTRVLPGGWLVLRERHQDAPARVRLYQIASTMVVPRQDFGLNGMVTRVQVEPASGLAEFDLRQTEVLAQSEELELFSQQVPRIEPMSGNAIRLSGLLPDLPSGRAVSVTGNVMKARVGDLGGVFLLEQGTPSEASPTGWESLALANRDVRALAINADGDIFAGTGNDGVYVQSGSDRPWRARNTGLTTRDVRTLVINSSDWTFAGTNGGGVFRSSDHGDYWTQCNEGLTRFRVNALVVDAAGRIFAGTDEGVFQSLDRGNSWVQAGSGLADSGGADVRALAVDVRGQVYAGTRGGGVFRWSDRENAWVLSSAGLSNLDVRALAADGAGNVLAGTAGGGVYFLPPGADRWSAMNDCLTFKDVRALAVGAQGEIFAGTRGGGVFRCAGPLARWEQLETGISNDVRALAWGPAPLSRSGSGPGRVVAGARNATLLTAPDGLGRLELRHRLLFSVGLQAAADLNQETLPQQVVVGLEDLVMPLSKDAAVAVREAGSAWAIEDPEAGPYLLRVQGGRINVYRPPDPLQVVAAPSPTQTRPAITRWELQDRLGFQGGISSRPGELSLVAVPSEAKRVGEVAHIQAAQVSTEGGLTTLVLSDPLQHVYDPRTVLVCANLAHATHGQTVEQEVLGGGNGGQAYQCFVLNHRSLTYTQAESSRGAASTLQVRVVSQAQPAMLPGVPLVRSSLEEGVPWEEVASLVHSRPDDRHYITYVNEDQRTRVVFGDGQRGARLPTGAENVVATYRYGTGREGRVAANSLTLLQRQPLGITAVTNPEAAQGGADAESMDTARAKAPVAVRPLGRIVSLSDYEDFIYGLPGVGKVQVKPLWNGQTRLAHVTVAATGGAAIDRDSEQYQAIVRAVQANRASPHHHVEIDPADILHFNLAATIYVSPSFSPEAVAAVVKESLLWTYSFEIREFGRGVAASDVTTLIQSVPGVQHVELTAFHTLGATTAVQPYLSAYTATWG